jgi:hypothetical protein
MGKNKLEVCKETRKRASDALYRALQKVWGTNKPISEALVRDEWLLELRKDENLLPDGWYEPPPHGMAVLFGTDEEGKTNRVNFMSLRDEKNWPKEEVLLDRERGIIAVYASPVDKKTGIIGDFGMTIYLGKNPEIIAHLQACYALNQETFRQVKSGVEFNTLYHFTIERMKGKGLSNDVETRTVQSAGNIGHTIPGSYEDWTPIERQIIQSQHMVEIKNLISQKRKYVNGEESFRVRNGMAFSIESRPRVRGKPHIPMTLFHQICLVHEDGKKELLSDFEEIFKLMGMDYMQTVGE